MSISQGGVRPFVHVNATLTPFRSTTLRAEALAGAAMFYIGNRAKTMFDNSPGAASTFYEIGPTQLPSGKDTENTGSYLASMALINALLAMQRRDTPPDGAEIISKWGLNFAGVQVSEGDDPYYPVTGPNGRRPIDRSIWETKRGRFENPVMTVRYSGLCDDVTTPLLSDPSLYSATETPMDQCTNVYATLRYVPITPGTVFRIDNNGTPVENPRGGLSPNAYQMALVTCNGAMTPDMLWTKDPSSDRMVRGYCMRIGRFASKSRDEIYSEKATFLARDPKGSFAMHVHPGLWK